MIPATGFTRGLPDDSMGNLALEGVLRWGVPWSARCGRISRQADLERHPSENALAQGAGVNAWLRTVFSQRLEEGPSGAFEESRDPVDFETQNAGAVSKQPATSWGTQHLNLAKPATL